MDVVQKQGCFVLYVADGSLFIEDIRVQLLR